MLRLTAMLLGAAACFWALAARGGEMGERELPGKFEWVVGPPLVSPADRPDDPCHAIKDPTIVRYGGRWHLFCSIRSRTRTHQIEYLSFEDLEHADSAERHVLTFNDGYFCAPQVFYFAPHGKWYLIH